MKRALSFTAFGLGLALIACSSASSTDDGRQGQSDDEIKQATAACSGKTCGDSCKLCPAGAGGNCFETAELKECNAQGKCTSAPAACSAVDAGPKPYEPCAGKTCGQSCKVCDPADGGCFETEVLKFCGASGACEATMPVCTPPKAYKPCENKACGDTCKLCGPADVNCFETAELKACDAKGACTAAPAACN
jgi:hypothetical protein